MSFVKKIKPCIFFLLLLAYLFPLTSFSQDSISGKLPQLLVAQNGTVIQGLKDWESIRRPEILNTFKREMYGQMPASTHLLSCKILESNYHALNGLAVRKQVRIYFSSVSDKHYMDILLYYPKTKKQVPVLLAYNSAGNQAVNADSNIFITHSWVHPKTPGSQGNHATEATRGIAAADWPVEKIVKAGYAIATIYAGDVAPDFAGGDTAGIQSLYPALQENNENFATLAAWAKGLSIAADYLQKDQAINAKQMIVMGTSRMGKAALWAGATDQRFAMVISNESGAGGAKLFHHVGGEDTRNLCKRFPYWFSKSFAAYNGQDTLMPFDQHQLLALIAPRPLYVASAIGSTITDSYGEFLAAKYASPVYQLYKKDGLRLSSFPGVNSPSFGSIGYHLREGNHGITDYDWTQFIAFANYHFEIIQKQQPKDLYLLIGQSNMAGRGPLTAAYEQAGLANLFMLNKQNNWVPAKNPLHFDKPSIAGVGPGFSFGNVMAAENPKRLVCLIPCAVGGTSIDVWKPGAYDEATHTHPYDDMLIRLKIALADGHLKGVLWLQGESDCSPEKAAVYMKKLQILIQRIRDEAHDPALPFVAGELGRYKTVNQNINTVLAQLPATVPHTAVASSLGFTDKGDQTHFDARSATEYGKRFAAKMKMLLRTEKNVKRTNKGSDASTWRAQSLSL